MNYTGTRVNSWSKLGTGVTNELDYLKSNMNVKVLYPTTHFICIHKKTVNFQVFNSELNIVKKYINKFEIRHE
jgi:hypothetical protein